MTVTRKYSSHPDRNVQGTTEVTEGRREKVEATQNLKMNTKREATAEEAYMKTISAGHNLLHGMEASDCEVRHDETLELCIDLYPAAAH